MARKIVQSSFKFKFSVLIGLFIILFFAAAISLFLTIQNDRLADQRIDYYASNVLTIQNVYDGLTRIFELGVQQTSDPDEKNREKYVHLTSSLEYQFKSILNEAGLPSEIRAVFVEEQNYFKLAQERFEELFSAKDTRTLSATSASLRRIEEEMLSKIRTISDKVYSQVADRFRERTNKYERLLGYYGILLLGFLVIGLGGMMVFFFNNFSRPYRKFMSIIKSVQDGDLKVKFPPMGNMEFVQLADAFNTMIQRVEETTHSLEEKKNRLEAVINTPSVGVIVLDDQQVQFLNKWATERFAEGNSTRFLTGGDEIDKISFNKVMGSAFETYVFEDKDKKGNTYECFINKIGRETLLIMFDVTDKVKLQKELKNHLDNLEQIVDQKTEELQKTYQELEENNKKLMELDELKNQFLQNISHELRTPLTSIIGYLEIVLNYGQVPPTQQNFLRIALENSLALQKVIDNLLELNEIESGRVKLKLQKININSFLQELVEGIGIQAQKKKLKVETSFNGGSKKKPLTVEGDEEKLRNVFNNLLSNAIKFTEKGKVKITTEDVDADHVAIMISDSGIGIAKTDIPIIFDKFQQVDSSISKAYEGTGLGLPIAKTILDMHGAEIKVDSKPGKGSTFTVVLKKQLF